MGPTTVNVLVYDNLPEGKYTLWIGDVAWASNVRIESGSVAVLDWKGTGLRNQRVVPPADTRRERRATLSS
jgi:hypothetical protein